MSVPRVARVCDVSVPLFSPLPSEKAARDEEEKMRMEAQGEHRRGRGRLKTTRLVDQSRSFWFQWARFFEIKRAFIAIGSERRAISLNATAI